MLTPHRLMDFNLDFAVRKAAETTVAELNSNFRCNSLSEFRVRIPRENL
jgi:hypothetical protein